MNVNSLQRKKPSEMMGEYVAGKNRVNVIPRTVTRGIDRAQPESPAVLRSVRRPAPTATPGMSRAEPEYKGAGAGVNKSPSGNFGGTVLTQEQILANNINDVIRRMNEIMSQPGNLLPASMSPYYNIYMEQYRKNAEAAEANAYARSVASTGGYGSSYATMAGQRAYSDTMEGFTELTPSMVQTKGQAMSELMQQYQMAKQMQTELKTQTKDVNDATYEAYVSAANGGWYTGDNETSLRARLENLKAGNPDIDVDKVLEMLKKEYVAPVKPDVNDATYGAYEDAMAVYSSTGDRSTVKAFLENLAAYNPDIDVDKVMEMFNKINPVYIGPEAPEDMTREENTEEERAAYQAAISVWDGSNPESVVRTLINLGYTEADAKAAMGMLEAEETAKLKDMQAKNLGILEKGMANLNSVDLSEYGYTEKEIAKMSSDEYAANAKGALLAYAGELKKKGELGKVPYFNLLHESIVGDCDYIMSSKADLSEKEKINELTDIVVSLTDYYESGYVDERVLGIFFEIIREDVKKASPKTWKLREEQRKAYEEGKLDKSFEIANMRTRFKNLGLSEEQMNAYELLFDFATLGEKVY